MRIWSHTLVKNEDKFIWFSVMSVIEYVDKVLIWDTGSNDLTLKIINEIKKLYPQKVEFREVGEVSIEGITALRQKMLEKTKSDWIILVDGDEVWWDDGIRALIDLIVKEGDKLESVVNRYFNLVGDIFHYQEEEAGRYEIDGFKGHLTIRAINTKINGLHVINPYPLEAYVDKNGTPVQRLDSKKRFHFIKPSYLHFTHLKRSTSLDSSVQKRSAKFKYEIGRNFPLDFFYPEVFFRARPSIVPDPWVVQPLNYTLKAILQKPLKFIKRRYLNFK